ncbi:MAG: hypothetical protein COA78_21900 [Blastopirellula sp.]|nr:MAG: hypothetical protein COA78_21900 [Blastopirellula sp.]
MGKEEEDKKQNLMNNLAIDIRRDEWDDKDDIAQIELIIAQMRLTLEKKVRSFEAKEKAHNKHFKIMLGMGFPAPQEDIIQKGCKSCRTKKIVD